MHRRLIALILSVALAALGLGGCGPSNPYSGSTPTDTLEHGDPRQPAPERRGARPPLEHSVAPGGASSTPTAALQRYATLYVNWTAQTLVSNLRELASISIGGARASAREAAARTGRDDTLRRAGVTNSGTVVAIARRLGAEDDAWIVVTSETTRGSGAYDGLPRHTPHVTYATVARLHAGWVVKSWQPQS